MAVKSKPRRKGYVSGGAVDTVRGPSEKFPTAWPYRDRATGGGSFRPEYTPPEEAEALRDAGKRGGGKVKKVVKRARR